MQKFFAGQSYAVRVVRAVEESHSITAKLVGIYNWVLRNKQHWMKYLYWAMNRFRPETREFFHKRCIGYVTELFERWCPHVVVSVHPLTQHIFARVLKELKLADRIPLVSVVTDPYYGFWKGWACDDVTLYLVASDEARRQLIDYGIAPERIKISGMPVHHKFAYPGEEAAQAARRALGLDPEKFTVFVNAGWEGGGNIPQIFRELVRGQLEVQAIFLAGQERRTARRRRIAGRDRVVSDQSYWLFRTRRAVDGRGKRHDFQTRRSDHLRSICLPSADHCRRHHAADAAGSRRGKPAGETRRRRVAATSGRYRSRDSSHG